MRMRKGLLIIYDYLTKRYGKEERNENIEQQDGNVHGIRDPKNDKDIKSVRSDKSVTGVSGF